MSFHGLFTLSAKPQVSKSRSRWAKRSHEPFHAFHVFDKTAGQQITKVFTLFTRVVLTFPSAPLGAGVREPALSGVGKDTHQ